MNVEEVDINDQDSELTYYLGSLDGMRQSQFTVSGETNEDKFKSIYDRLYMPVFYFARKFVGVEDAEDIVATAFVKLWRSDVDLTIIPKVKTWLNVVTRNSCIDLLSQKKRETASIPDIAYLFHHESDQEWKIREALIERLHQEVEKLPPKCRKVFKMAYLEGQSSRKIAEALGISENTVTNHRVKALKLLRIVFKDYALAMALLLEVNFR